MQSNKITKFLKLAVISSIAVVASISLSSYELPLAKANGFEGQS